MALTDKLTAIADAIRAKTGKPEKLTLDQMPVEIAGIKSGTGGMVTSAALLSPGYTVMDGMSLSVEIPDETEETTE